MHNPKLPNIQTVLLPTVHARYNGIHYSIIRMGTFQCTPLLDKCFQSIKAIAMRSPILKLVDFNKNEPVWVITDSSQTGISAMYGQGASWDTS